MTTPSSYAGLQPGQLIRPCLTSNQVPDLVKKVFGLTIIDVKEMKSYDDKNYLIKVSSSWSNDHLQSLSPNGYVLKILNSLDTKNEGFVDGQHQMMIFLGTRGHHVPQPVPNINGTFYWKEKLKCGNPGNEVNCNMEDSEYMVRMLTFIPGEILVDVPYTAELFYEGGQYLIQMDNDLKDFRNDAIAARSSIWMLSNVPQLRHFIFAIRDPKRHRLIQEILDSWDENVTPMLCRLEKGIIHGDFNEQNIVVRADAANPSKYHINGLIDFGDVSHSCYLFELVLFIMYMMIESREIPPLEVGGHVLAGYLTVRKLSAEEWDILKVCVAARFAQSLVLGAYSYEQDPGNEYLLTTSVRGWDVLQEFWSSPDDGVIARWKRVISTYGNL